MSYSLQKQIEESDEPDFLIRIGKAGLAIHIYSIVLSLTCLCTTLIMPIRMKLVYRTAYLPCYSC